MSPICLRADARLCIIRGFTLLRAIELARQAIDDELLEARMETAGLDDDDDLADGEWIPTTEEIEAARDGINAGWDDAERERRWLYRIADVEKARARGASHYQRHAVEIREQRREQRRDPAFRERTRVYNQRYRERHAAAFKEREAARREVNNAKRRERRAKNHDAFLEQTRAYRASRREILNQQSRGYKAARRRRERSESQCNAMATV